MSEQSSEFTPDTIVLVHGLWMTPRSWENWVEHFEAQGYQVSPPRTPASRSRSRRCARTRTSSPSDRPERPWTTSAA